MNDALTILILYSGAAIGALLWLLYAFRPRSRMRWASARSLLRSLLASAQSQNITAITARGTKVSESSEQHHALFIVPHPNAPQPRPPSYRDPAAWEATVDGDTALSLIARHVATVQGRPMAPEGTPIAYSAHIENGRLVSLTVRVGGRGDA